MQNNLLKLLHSAAPQPSYISSKDGGSIVSLCLHCLMVQDGFTIIDDSTRKRHSKYQPPVDWSSQFPDQWIFRYSKESKVNCFVLHCSLQTRSGRLFIHASEENNPSNIQVLGLLVPNYVLDPSKIKENSWKGVIDGEDKMIDLFKQHILEPLERNAEARIINTEDEKYFKKALARFSHVLTKKSSTSYFTASVAVITLGIFVYLKKIRK
uniref:PI31 proteasome regulator N-terminal domain-containing protein n=1 Tax=Polytomella parva TaxID=51329 RepID=A0A7S0Y9I7_9CHLO|mmetsp:Transcript_11184/g.20242  ORF Transcript_11184/g.20242 Transcript_11184/m.20242 type:complete len:210 (+) Transcript_11184:147-776(+)